MIAPDEVIPVSEPSVPAIVEFPVTATPLAETWTWPVPLGVRTSPILASLPEAVIVGLAPVALDPKDKPLTDEAVEVSKLNKLVAPC